jgi:hypothetical protein
MRGGGALASCQVTSLALEHAICPPIPAPHPAPLPRSPKPRFWALEHPGLFCQVPVFLVSADLWWWQFWVPTNPVGWWNWAGNMSLVTCVVILVTSFALVRRRAYNTFRAVHYALWAVRGWVRSAKGRGRT